MSINSVKGQTMTAYQGSVPTATYKKTESAAKTGTTKVEAPKTDVTKTESAQEINKSQADNSAEDVKNIVKPGEMETEEIKKFIDQLNKHANSSAVFGYHEATHRITIKIIDRDTDEVIKEIPPEKMLDMIAKTWELAGLLVDERR